ncbi:hypothetical protein LZ30DRAFT_702732 [Colletotrichum cereale]|nr:hypothetical protein LZ30DRAFT_702732 [Colletotrichum cereale]
MSHEDEDEPRERRTQGKARTRRKRTLEPYGVLQTGSGNIVSARAGRPQALLSSSGRGPNRTDTWGKQVRSGTQRRESAMPKPRLTGGGTAWWSSRPFGQPTGCRTTSADGYFQLEHARRGNVDVWEQSVNQFTQGPEDIAAYLVRVSLSNLSRLPSWGLLQDTRGWMQLCSRAIRTHQSILLRALLCVETDQRPKLSGNGGIAQHSSRGGCFTSHSITGLMAGGHQADRPSIEYGELARPFPPPLSFFILFVWSP